MVHKPLHITRRSTAYAYYTRHTTGVLYNTTYPPHTLSTPQHTHHITPLHIHSLQHITHHSTTQHTTPYTDTSHTLRTLSTPQHNISQHTKPLTLSTTHHITHHNTSQHNTVLLRVLYMIDRMLYKTVCPARRRVISYNG